MKNVTKFRPGRAWYDNYEYYCDLSLKYLSGFNNLPNEVEHHLELKSFSKFMNYKLIFESNLIEGEGLSELDTRKVIDENFPKNPK